MGKWKTCTLSTLGNIVGGATPSTKNPQNYEGGTIPWITPKDLSGFSGRYISRGERNITEVGLNSCSAQMIPKHSILFSSRAPIGYVAISACEVCTNQGFKSIVPNEDTDYLFLYYLLKYKKNDIENMGSGTTFKEISGNTMKSIEAYVPIEKTEQIAIAKILSSLDDKIELNNRINDNLEQQIITIFDKLFSDLIIDKSLFVPMGEIADFKYGTMPKKDKIQETGYPIFSGYKIVGYYPEKMFENPQLIIVARGVGGCGDVKFTPKDCYLTNLSIAIIPSDLRHELYMFYYLKQQDMKILNTGSAQPQITISSLANYNIPIPNIEDIETFNSFAVPFVEMVRKNEIEIKQLSNLRDFLLPRLMSGEIDISDIHL